MLVAGRWFRNIPLASAADKRSEVGQGTCILKLSNGTAHKKERRSRSFAHPVAPRLTGGSPLLWRLLLPGWRLLLRRRLWRRTPLRSRVSLLLWPWLRSRTLLRCRFSLLLRRLRSRTLLRRRFSLLLWPWLRSRTLLRCRFNLLLRRLRSRTLLRRGFSLLLWPWLRSRTLLRCRFNLLLRRLRSRTRLRRWSSLGLWLRRRFSLLLRWS